jgi:hypothetical protein
VYLFEFDGKKSQINLEKLGIDFVDAQQLWADPDLVEVQARATDAPRSLVIGSIEGNVCTGLWSGMSIDLHL